MRSDDAWTPPAELVQPTPRLTVRTEAHRQRMLLALALCLLPLVGVASLSAWTSYRMGELRQQGKIAPAIVERLYKTTRQGRITDHVSYVYRLADGQAYLASIPIWPKAYQRLYSGEHVRAVYLPSDETFSTLGLVLRIAWAHPWQRFYLTVRPLFVLFLLLLFFVLGCNDWVYRRERRLLETGSVAPALIKAVKEVRGRYGGRKWRISYEYQLADGDRVSGETTRSASTWAGSEHPTVLFDPASPRRHLLYPATTVRCEK